MKSRLIPLFALTVFWCCSVGAEVRLPRLFGDSMVLQQKASNAVWGWASPGETVKVQSSWGARGQTTAGSDGTWKVFLETPEAGTGHHLKIEGQNRLTLEDVAIGEVWLCLGQSNMGWSTGNSFEADGESNVDLPGLRLFRSAREHWHEPLDENRDRICRWKRCDAESAAETSAVSYYFGKTLHKHLGVPVGIIQRAYAGTPIEGWMPWEIQQDDPVTVAVKKQLDELSDRRIRNGRESVEKSLAEFKEQLNQYNAKVDAGETMLNRFRPLSPPIITKPQVLGHQYPAHIFNAMVHPVRPYGIRGMIWYQGERNSKNVPQAFHYRSQLPRLVEYYRQSWHEQSEGNVPDDFPFQFTQLPSWNPPQEKPVESLEAPWAVNRESMLVAEGSLPNVSMVVSIDTGDAVELHPKNKKPIGQRHAYAALAGTYQLDGVGNGPRLRSHRITGSKVILEFDQAGSGLMAARGEPLDSFAIAGKDRQWHWAEAEIDGSRVVVHSDRVEEPLAVRYAWAMNPSQRNLVYNREGFPASPFRTDDWPLSDPEAELVEVNKPEKPSGYVARDWKRPPMKPFSER